MANIIDYAEKYSTVSTKDMPYNELDGLVLSELAYIHWDNVVPGIGEPSQMTLREAIISLQNNNPDYYKSLDENFQKLLNGIVSDKNGSNSRYGSMIISNYYAPNNITINEVSTSEDIRQFAAVTFFFDNGSGNPQNVISYRGTDCTLEGWHEDFNMAYDLHTESQITARDYLNSVGKNSSGDLILAGHSKGANNATYSYLYCDDSIRDRIVRVQSYDGPGLPKETVKNENYSRLLELLEGSAAPYDSVIGLLLFENGFNFVDTDKGMVEDHDGFSWKVDLDNVSFIYKEQNFLSKYINTTLDNYLAVLPLESRRYLINSIFDFIYSDIVKDYDGDGKDFDDVLKYFGERKLGALVDIWNADTPVSDKIMIYSAIIVAIPIALLSLAEVAVVEFIDWAISIGEKFVTFIESKINEFVSWSKEKIQQFKNSIREAFSNAKKAIKDFWNRHFNKGYKEATAHPQIVLDTYKMRSYAQRIQGVNRRIGRLDQRMDSLYWQVGLADLWSLVQADWLTKYSKRLEKCAGYLNDTASDFEKCESELIGSI